MTYEQTREQFLIAWNSNAYLNICESDDMHNAIVALEKQIPKKPIPTEEQDIRYVMNYTCPSCGKHFSGTGIANYCYHCGQALDWREME